MSLRFAALLSDGGKLLRALGARKRQEAKSRPCQTVSHFVALLDGKEEIAHRARIDPSSADLRAHHKVADAGNSLCFMLWADTHPLAGLSNSRFYFHRHLADSHSAA